MVALHALTLFVSAALLFLVQPLFARLVLPLLGGSPAVWNTAMVFYQAVLLAGYAYAHSSTSRLGVRRQAAWHLLVLLVPLFLLPIAIPTGWTPPASANPAGWLVALMVVAVGAPFFAISTTSPVVQTWFASSPHTRAADPYFLYAASNLGSLLALVAYPLWIEPHLTLATQTKLWSAGYLLLVLFVGACAIRLWRTPHVAVNRPRDGLARRGATPPPLPPGRRTTWVLLSFAPSSLLLGVTTYLSSEVAVIPLLWIIPLALYLLTFVLVFSRRALVPRPLLARTLPLAVVALVMTLNLRATQPIAGLMALHLVVFLLATLLCHARLAAERPEPVHLTEFYLWLSVGGVLGGLFNALLAPLIFNSVAEYPLALLLAVYFALSSTHNPSVNASAAPDTPESSTAKATPHERIQVLLAPALLGLLTGGLIIVAARANLTDGPASAALIFGLPTLLAYFLSRHALRFVLGLGAILFAGSFYHGERGQTLHAERSFFGVHRVARDPSGEYHLLAHGQTLHGRQSLAPDRAREPLTYYHRTGPIGQILAHHATDPRQAVAVVGLGAGSLASYARPGQPWTFFEIDPVVEKIARDPRYFTYLRDTPATLRVVIGDARLTLAGAADGSFELLVLDAFSSDAIPLHLVTREALALYRHKLTPTGLLACHISNLHLDLEPVFARLARDAGWLALVRDDTDDATIAATPGKSPSIWLVMAQTASPLGPLTSDPRWQPARESPSLAVWTDDHSSLLPVFRWR